MNKFKAYLKPLYAEQFIRSFELNRNIGFSFKKASKKEISANDVDEFAKIKS